MGSLLKRIWASAPIWAWVVMIVCVVVLIVGLVVSGNRTSGVSSTASSGTPSDAAPSSTAPTATPATVAFMDSAKSSPKTPKTIVLLGDATGADQQGWAPALGSAISKALDRPVATKYWNTSTEAYGPMTGLGEGTNGPIGYWNGSTAGKGPSYAQENLAKLIRPEVTPDLILLNYASTPDQGTPLAAQVQPLIDQLTKKYPKAKIAVIKQSVEGASSDQSAGYAAAMDAEGIQVIDVHGAFPSDQATKAVLTAFGLSSQ
ncbi:MULTISPECIES: SGNH/GDSL hydrolase family protein [unclassified Gordonia (in: high G+C Gram-positive bacteria)]|uniref:SGNH/GDSL hydrolase family protein n=1 Tax=unclassified Gordonia (in: high G+C Gram-positive bacteria) TaxID=2657482 RepID=UPI000AFE3A0B|nr:MULTISPECIES: SGNH/GDSL hydrolase family protein [unclassified Gordonia (in: high G+C Gram-positive bacteria)]